MDEKNRNWKGKTYLLVKVIIAPLLLKDFNEYFAKECLPMWTKYGARHIRSFVYQAGGPSNELIRIFEFDNINSWGSFRDALVETDEGRNYTKNLYSKWNIIAEMILLRAIL